MEIVEMAGDSPVVARVSYDLYSPEYKRGMVLEWANSGSSQKGFAREKGIPDTTFSGWVKKWRAEGCPGLDGAEGPSAGPALVEAAPPPGSSSTRAPPTSGWASPACWRSSAAGSPGPLTASAPPTGGR